MWDPFSIFRSFGGSVAPRSSLYAGRDPFDDPFFRRPFEDLLEPSTFISSAPSSDSQEINGGKGILIKELLSDDEELNDDKDTGEKELSVSVTEPSVEHPEDDADAEKEIQNVKQKSDYNRVESTHSQARRFQTYRVTYGGVDGAYYTSTKTRRASSDGVVLEESKEADKTKGQATHRISRGINDKGHSRTRKLNSDGRMDTTQTLHNLNEDDLGSFEEAWKGNFRGHLSDWTDEFNRHGTTGSESGDRRRESSWGGRLLPSLEKARFGADIGTSSNPSGGRTKKVVRINIE